MNVPVVFLVFNRPELTRRVLSRIRKAQPKQLIVVCDGHRDCLKADLEKVSSVRQVISEEINWSCSVRYEYSPVNLGCRERIVSGLNWAFSQIEEAIILEDDCLPDPSFFLFAEEMLKRFRHDPRVFHIGGSNFTREKHVMRHSYAFSRYGHIWGWATWRRAWKLYESDLTSWKKPSERNMLMSGFQLADERGYWGSIFDRCAAHPVAQTTWDYQWTYACWKHCGLAVYPSTHLVENIGQGLEATHTVDFNPLFARRSEPISLPLVHPSVVSGDARLDREVFRAVFMNERFVTDKIWRRLQRRFGYIKK